MRLASSSTLGFRMSVHDQGATLFLPQVAILLTGRISQNWELKQPVSLKIERDEHGFIISDDVFAVFGEGKTLDQARDDFVSALAEYHEILKRHAHQDSASAEQLKKFQQFWLPPE